MKIRRHIAMVPDQVDGVRIDEKFLKEKFGDTADEGLVLGGLEVSDNVRAFIDYTPSTSCMRGSRRRTYTLTMS